MNNEIKEILDRIETACEIFDCLLKPEECTELLDYITNLQQELERIVKDDEKNQETIIRLSKENERLKEANKVLEENWEHYMKCCGKAIEILKKYNGYEENYYVPVDEVLNILQNGSDKE